MIKNKGQLKVQGLSEANLAYRSLKENWAGGRGRGTNEKEEKKKDPNDRKREDRRDGSGGRVLTEQA